MQDTPKQEVCQSNRILGALSSKEYKRLRPSLALVTLVSGTVLHDEGDLIEHVYFPLNSLISQVSHSKSGTSVNNGLIGNDGVSGLTRLMEAETVTAQAVVRIGGTVIRAPFEFIKKEIAGGGELQDLIQRCLSLCLQQTLQTVACCMSHSVEERLAGWLLMCQERVGVAKLRLTQNFIAQMLYTRRESVSRAANYLQTKGLIKCGRENLQIVNQRGLKGSSCECYRETKAEADRVWGLPY